MTILPEVNYIDLTPVVAAKFLQKVHPLQRKLKPTQIKNLSSLLIHGDYGVEGQTIQTDTNGYLVNGQHTCIAVVQTGISLPHIKHEWNVSENARAVADAGAGRTAFDQIKAVSGHTLTQASTATLKILLTKPSSDQTAKFKDTYHRQILKKFEEVKPLIEKMGGLTSAGTFAMIPSAVAPIAATGINALGAHPKWENGNHIIRWCHIAQHGKPHSRDPYQSLSAAEAKTALAWFRHTKEGKRYKSRETMVNYRQLCRLMIHFIQGTDPYSIRDSIRAPENLAKGVANG